MKRYGVVAGVLVLLIGGSVIGVYRYRTHSIFLDYIAQGDAAYRNGDYSHAITLYQQASARKSTSAIQERIQLAQQGLQTVQRLSPQTSRQDFTNSGSSPAGLVSETVHKPEKPKPVSPHDDSSAGDGTRKFVKVAWLEGVNRNQVVIIGPTWDSPAGRRTRQLARSLEARSIPHKLSTSLAFSSETTRELLDAWRQVMQGSPPIVFINGTATANPTLDDVLAQFQKMR